MYIVTKEQFEDLIQKYPNGGIVFSEEKSNDILITDGSFGATCLAPIEGEVSDQDWNIKEFGENDTFVIYDNSDILQMIQTLTKRLQIELHWNDDFYDA